MQRALVANVPLIKKGLQVLVRSLGVNGASRFIMGIERGEGNSILEFRKIWEGKSVRGIHKTVLEAKRKGII